MLQPGEASEARFEFLWRSSGTEIFGLAFEMDLTIREITALPGNQFQLGREHALHFSGLSAGSAAASPASAPITSAPAPAATPASAPPTPMAADACGGKAGCYSAGPFVAEVTGITPSQVNAYHVMDVRVRFRNLTNQPIVLAYAAGSVTLYRRQGSEMMKTRVNLDFPIQPGDTIVVGERWL